MKSGYKLLWSDRAANDLQNIIDYLQYKWTDKEIQSFARRLDKRLNIILLNPELFPKTSKRKNIRRSVLTKHTTIYYETTESQVYIVTLFDSRKDPRKRRL